MKIPKAPASLGKDGSMLWSAILRNYAIDDPASLAILRSMCETADRLAACRATIDAEGLVTAGSTGQPRAHPLLQIESESRRALLAHSRALRLDLSEGY